MKSTGARPPPEPPVTRPGVTPAGEAALGRVGLCVDRDELLVPGVRAPTLGTTRPSTVGSGGGKCVPRVSARRPPASPEGREVTRDEGQG